MLVKITHRHSLCWGGTDPRGGAVHLHPREEYELPDEYAEQLIKAGRARPVNAASSGTAGTAAKQRSKRSQD